MVGLQPVEMTTDPLPDLQRACPEGRGIEHVDRRQRGRTGDGVAAIGTTQTAWIGRIHDLGTTGDRRQRHAAGDRLATDQQVRHQPVVLHREQPPGPTHAALHFVSHEKHAVFTAARPQVSGKAGRQRQETTLALYSLHHHGGHRLRRHLGNQRVVELVDAVLHVVVLAHTRRAAVGVGKRQAIHLGRERAESVLEQGVLAGHTERQVGPAMVGTLEHDQCLPARVRPRHLDRGFDGLGTTVEQGGLLVEVTRDTRIEALAHLDVGFIGRDDRTHVDQAPCLVADRIDHRWRHVPCRQRADAAGEIEKGVAIHVGHRGTITAGDGNPGEAGRTTRHRRISARHEGHAVGTGHCGHKLDRRHAFTCLGFPESRFAHSIGSGRSTR